MGAHLVERLLHDDLVDRLVVYSRDELKHFDLSLRLGELARHVDFVIGDVRDAERIGEACAGIDVVIHAAAMKQVPACEVNPTECYKTNVAGTENVIRAAKEAGVSRMVFVSTDKAVEPVSVYGNSKQAGERLVLKANSDFLATSVVRFGNLIGSPGSIVDLLKKQTIQEITIYSPELTRFYDSLDNAWGLVKAQLHGHFGGAILLPKLRAIRVPDLVSWTNPAVKIKFGGERGFEKIHEKLATENELHRMVETASFYIITQEALSLDEGLDTYGGGVARLDSYSSAGVPLIESSQVLSRL